MKIKEKEKTKTIWVMYIESGISNLKPLPKSMPNKRLKTIEYIIDEERYAIRLKTAAKNFEKIVPFVTTSSMQNIIK